MTSGILESTTNTYLNAKTHIQTTFLSLIFFFFLHFNGPEELNYGCFGIVAHYLFVFVSQFSSLENL